MENQLKAGVLITWFSSRFFEELLNHLHKKKVAIAKKLKIYREGPILIIKLVV
jgi:hypothetical protein